MVPGSAQNWTTYAPEKPNEAERDAGLQLMQVQQSKPQQKMKTKRTITKTGAITMKNRTIVLLLVTIATVAFCLPRTVSASAGDLYLSDDRSNSIIKLAPNGTQSTFAAGLAGPGGLAFDRAGDLFEVDQQSGTIFKFLLDGTKSTFASGTGTNLTGLAVDAANNLYAADVVAGSIYRFTPNGMKSVFAAGVGQAFALAFDGSGNLFVAGSAPNKKKVVGTIFKITPAGVASTFASRLNSPRGLAFDGAGNLFVSDEGSGRILKFSPSASETVFYSQLNYYPNGLAFDAAGNLFAVETTTGVISKFTPTGVRSNFAALPGSTVEFIAFEPAVLQLIYPAGTTIVTSPINISSPITQVQGAGIGKTIFVRGTGLTLPMFNIIAPNCTVSGITVDSGSNPSAQALVLTGSGSCVAGAEFKNFYIAIESRAAGNNVSSCAFTNSSGLLNFAVHRDMGLTDTSSTVTIDSNTSTGACWYFTGGVVFFTNNNISGAPNPSGGQVDIGNAFSSNTIATITGNSVHDGGLPKTGGFELGGGTFTVTSNSVYNHGLSGIGVGHNASNVSISHNTVYNSGQYLTDTNVPQDRSGVYVLGGVQGINISYNNFFDNQSPHTQTYGIILCHYVPITGYLNLGPTSNITITGNNYNGLPDVLNLTP
jgi:sugar lactone lactonase YvrE